jgi:heme O synthase-like polyprenyltransferase
MTALAARTLYWAPRMLGILFAAFISIFALDVVEENRGLGQMLLALAMPLIPTALVALVLVLAWRREWIGAVSFFALGLIYAIWARQHPSWILLIGGPLFLVGALFLGGWLARKAAPAQP